MDALPGDSAYKTAIRDSIPDEQLAQFAKRRRETHGVWSHESLLLATLVDLLSMQVRGLRPTSDFEPYPRPGIVRAPARRALSPEGLAYLQKIRAEHEREHGYSTRAGTPEAG